MVCKSYSNKAVIKKLVTQEAQDAFFPTFEGLPHGTGMRMVGISSRGKQNQGHYTVQLQRASFMLQFV